MARLSFLFHRASIIVVIGYACTSLPGSCLEQKKAEAARPVDAAASTNEIKQFCANNAAIAGDARIARQTSKLLELESQIKQRLTELEARKAQLVEWLRARDEAMKKASDAVTAIYTHMKPDAAASLLAAMDDPTAAAIIAKLSPRIASAILNEMEPARAAQLTHGIVALDGKKS
jgi:flagellar motility protein MotE (MotC chaperone)